MTTGVFSHYPSSHNHGSGKWPYYQRKLVLQGPILHFHERKSSLFQDFLNPVAIFEQIDGSHLHDFKYATLDASELPISWYGCYIPGAGQPEVDNLPPWFTRSFLHPPDDFFLSRQISESTIFMFTQPTPNVPSLRNTGLIFGLEGKPMVFTSP